MVVGAGFSGTLLVCQLLRSTALRHAEQPLRLIWIERSGQFGQGLAYGTRDPNHLLNVSAGAMSAWADDPSHLLRWLELNREALQEQHLEGANASSFLPRQLYGQYLQTVLRDALAQAGGRCQLTKLQAELVDLERCPEPRDGIGPRYRLQLQGHGQRTARAVVLAWGNSAIPIGATNDPAIRHGWGDHPTSGLTPDAAVALIGTGLTMVDMVVSLQRQGHRGPIVALSRRGHRPKPHRKVRPYGPWLSTQEAPNTVLGLWRRIRSEIRHAQNQGEDWRAVVDGLRPITQELWQRLDHQQRHRFMRHAAVVWDVHRHRIAPELHDLLAGLEESGQLQILAGQVLEYSRQGDHLQLTLRRRGQQRLEQHIVDRVIICTGIPLSYGTSAEPLLSTLRQRGLLLPNDQGLGCRCDSTGALLDAQGQAQPGLYTLGSPRKGDLWESVAVPELRLQARDLAQQLLAAWPERLRALAPAHVDASVPASVQPAAPQAPLVRQLFDAESSTYTYLLADPLTGDAALVDPDRKSTRLNSSHSSVSRMPSSA